MFFKKSFLALSFLCLALAGVYLLSIAFIPPAKSLPEEDVKSPFLELPNIPASGDLKTEMEESSSKEELPVGEGGKAKGKITERTIAYEGANLKYGKIYIKNSTSQNIDLKKELLAGIKYSLTQTNKPQVLIVHTHTTECFMEEKRNYYTDADKTRTTDSKKNMVAVGDILASELKNKGIGVIHATEVHDYPEYTGSYTRAEATVKKYLKKYPEIKVVIDLHRDSVSNGSNGKTSLTTKIKGKSAAQLMIVQGCNEGSVENYENWRENFRLAIRLQQSLEVMYPTLARPMLFTARRYNQHLSPGSLLIECGTEANTLEEAKYSATLLASSLAVTLKNL